MKLLSLLFKFNLNLYIHIRGSPELVAPKGQHGQPIKVLVRTGSVLEPRDSV
jgi:hypothetical protein